jgi:phytoene dehydrogenase-like protein
LSNVDAVVVGAGPNGLAAAIVLARAGLSVQVFEARDTPGGGCRSAELTLAGFVHDVCAAVFATAVVSPFLRELPLSAHGVRWLYPPVSLAHPLPDGPPALVAPGLDRTAESLRGDGPAYRRLIEPLLDSAEVLWPEILAPAHWPLHPLALARFGLRALRPAAGLARAEFAGEPARALFAGCAAHSFLPLSKWATSAIALVLAMSGHSPGWCHVEGGAGRLADALVRIAGGLGVSFVTGHHVRTIDELPPARAYLFDVAPRHLAEIAATRLPPRYRDRLHRYRYGPSAFKLDWALSGPIPWRDEACRTAATVHVAGSFEEIVAGEAMVSRGAMPESPFVLVAQPSVVDPTRAPRGQHTGWAYAHVPHGWPEDVAPLVESHVERFAPGFRDTILARSVRSPAALERENPNDVGGHIIGGVGDLRQLFTRPVARLVPYATPDSGVFICSASTPPGAGVHGMCGYHAAKAALARRFR